MAFVLRPIAPADTPVLREMLYYAAHLYEEQAPWSWEDPRLQVWFAGWGRGGDRGLIAVDEAARRPLGAAWLRLHPEGASTGYVDEHTPELAIGIVPESRGQGLGGALLSALIETVRAEVPAIVLTVRDGNPARRLYERHGFVEIGRAGNRVGGQSTKMLLDLRGGSR